MKVQTRSIAGALCEFNTLLEAIEFAHKHNSAVSSLDEFTPPTQEQLCNCIWKISFPLPNGERIRMTWEGGSWVLHQMEDEVPALQKES